MKQMMHAYGSLIFDRFQLAIVLLTQSELLKVRKELRIISFQTWSMSASQTTANGRLPLYIRIPNSATRKKRTWYRAFVTVEGEWEAKASSREGISLEASLLHIHADGLTRSQFALRISMAPRADIEAVSFRIPIPKVHGTGGLGVCKLQKRRQQVACDRASV